MFTYKQNFQCGDFYRDFKCVYQYILHRGIYLFRCETELASVNVIMFTVTHLFTAERCQQMCYIWAQIDVQSWSMVYASSNQSLLQRNKIGNI